MEFNSRSRQPQDSAVKASVQLGQHKTKVRFDALRLELETRLPLEATPAMDVWSWLVRHAGWLLERYHVKGNEQTAFEDCFGKPYQGEVKFAEAALFRVAASPNGRI